MINQLKYFLIIFWIILLLPLCLLLSFFILISVLLGFEINQFILKFYKIMVISLLLFASIFSFDIFILRTKNKLDCKWGYINE